MDIATALAVTVFVLALIACLGLIALLVWAFVKHLERSIESALTARRSETMKRVVRH